MSEQIFCFGDGYAANHIWPEWPAILSVLYTSVKNYGAIGAGNEFITTSIIDAHRKNPDAFFIVQWAQHDRFDKLLEDSSWDFTISTDKIYNFNVVPVEQRKWWLSSASSQDEVRKYHDFYVQEQQSILRTDNSKYLIQRLLDNRALFFSTQEMESFSKQIRFAETRLDQIQPSPIVHMAFVEEIILPRMPFFPNKSRLDKLKHKILNNVWIPFHWDRDKIWQDLIKDI